MKKIVLSITLILAIFPLKIFAGEIYNAIKSGNFKRVKQFLEENKNIVNEQRSSGLTPFAMACFINKLKVVELLLPYCSKKTINTANKIDHDTPLHRARCKNNLEMVKLFILDDAGESINNVAIQDLRKIKNKDIINFISTIPKNNQTKFVFLIKLVFYRSLDEVLEKQTKIKNTIFFNLDLVEKYKQKIDFIKSIIKKEQERIPLYMKKIAEQFDKEIKSIFFKNS